jgi:hypothetical protein
MRSLIVATLFALGLGLVGMTGSSAAPTNYTAIPQAPMAATSSKRSGGIATANGAAAAVIGAAALSSAANPAT